MKRFIRYLDSLSNLGISPSLAGIKALSRELGQPQKKFDSIQITGTNGKTSTARILSAILKNHGLKCGLYLSPHLQTYNERWSINGYDIGDRELEILGLKLIEYVKAANAKLTISGASPSAPTGKEGLASVKYLTQFEVLTGFALAYFRESAVDAAVMEVGMGGRWDATSIIHPKVAVVTTITIDHADFLGDTLAKIAREKSYVIKKGTNALAGYVRPSVQKILRRRAANREAQIKFLGQDFSFRADSSGDTFTVRGLFRDYPKLRLNLIGDFQRQNAAIAIAAAETYLGRALEPARLSKALLEAKSPGRLEIMETSPTIILDGAHNPAGAAELRRALEKDFNYGRLFFVISMLRDKDVPAFLQTVMPLAAETILTTNHNPRALSAKELAFFALEIDPKVSTAPNLKAAVDRMRAIAGPPDTICITGSLYGVGEARSLW